MHGCSSCLEMRGWADTEEECCAMVLEVWGDVVRRSIETSMHVYVCSPNVYMKRQKYANQRVKFQTLHVKPEAFRRQQEKFLSDFVAHPSKEAWDMLHPLTQRLSQNQPS